MNKKKKCWKIASWLCVPVMYIRAVVWWSIAIFNVRNGDNIKRKYFGFPMTPKL